MILQGDCVSVMAGLPAESVDAIVTDPPYGLEFMGKEWDKLGDAGFTKPGIGEREIPWPSYGHGGIAQQKWHEAWAREALRVLKPGGYLLSFGGSRTYHRMACAVEDAGFEIRDQLQWIYGSGFPKSLDVSKAIDKAAGAERKVVGRYQGASNIGKLEDGKFGYRPADGTNAGGDFGVDITKPATPEAQEWEGWGTALKPAHEPIVMARKPFPGTVAGNVLRYGTGAINVDACRIEGTWDRSTPWIDDIRGDNYNRSGGKKLTVPPQESHPAGRWPANLILSPEAAALLDAQSGVLAGKVGMTKHGSGTNAVYGNYARSEASLRTDGISDTGGASRFFYTAKSSRRERNAGLDGLDSIEIVTVQYTTWENEEREARLLVDTAQSRPKVIGVSGVPNSGVTEWSMLLYGNESTGQSPPGITFTIETASRSITESKTLSWLHRSITNESIADANCETVNGGSPAESAEPSILLSITTSEKMAYLPGVGNVTSGTQLRIRGNVGVGASNVHPT